MGEINESVKVRLVPAVVRAIRVCEANDPSSIFCDLVRGKSMIHIRKRKLLPAILGESIIYISLKLEPLAVIQSFNWINLFIFWILVVSTFYWSEVEVSVSLIVVAVH